MDRRNWLWKKKSPKEAVSKADSTVAPASSRGNLKEHQGNPKSIVDYVQISQERYAHLSAMEDQMKVLNEKLSDALSEITNKDNVVKQHTKVAEEAVSGWEKAEAESSSLKGQLESLMLLKLAAEEKSVQIDGALKECMKQVRNVKEESEQKLHDVIFAKTEQFEKMTFEFELKLGAFEQELRRSSAENDLLSKSIQEHSDLLMKVSEEKSQADAEILVLKADIQSYEREISSLRYEVHVVSKELEIRNEEKNMCSRSAEVANKQHLEDVKKIIKLEAECQRLRSLVRKKLPGPAALAQMKQEVDNWGRDHAEEKLRRNSAKISSPRFRPTSDFSLENIQQLHKENEFLTARLLAMEEEAKMLKEALSDRKNELLFSRDMFSRTAIKLHTVEEKMRVLDHKKCSSNSNFDLRTESSPGKNLIKAQSPMSMLEDGIDDVSCCESWDTTSISEHSHVRKGKSFDRFSKTNNSDQLSLLDDFLEMEKLACFSTESGGANYVSDHLVNTSRNKSSDGTPTYDPMQVQTTNNHHLNVHLSNPASGNEDELPKKTVPNEIPFSELQSEIGLVFESHGKNVNMGKLLGEIKDILQKVQDKQPQNSGSSNTKDIQVKDASCDWKKDHEERLDIDNCGLSLCADEQGLDENLKRAIIHVRDVVVSLGKGAVEMQDGPFNAYELGPKIGEFCSTVDKFQSADSSVRDFLLILSCALSETKELCFRMLHSKDNEGGSNSSDCVDKVTLLEKKVVLHEHEKNRFTDSSSDSDIVQEGRSYPSSEEMHTLRENPVEYVKQLKLENKSLVIDLTRSNESLEQKKHDFLEKEQQMVVLKSQLAACQKSNNLAETQLKCMTESYTSLESRCQDLEAEINMLRKKTEALENELQEERCTHQDDLAKFKNLQEQMERKEKCLLISEAEANSKAKQDREIAAAAEKLAECQETILLLGRQLRAMNPPANLRGSLSDDKHRISDGYLEGILSTNDLNTAGPNPKVENIASILRRAGDESPFEGYSCHFSPCDNDASPVTMSPVSSKRPKHRSTWSVSSTSSSVTTEKHGRGGFSRFFSKGKSDR